MGQFTIVGTSDASPTPSAVAAALSSPTALPSPTSHLGQVVVESPGAVQPTLTPVPPTLTPTPPPQPTDTPGASAPTETPSEPSATPEQTEPTPTAPPAPVGANTITLDDNAFSGGYTNKS